ncbi:uncharacterized protein LOC131165532 [Malania oleifera]|uniref:uncharacterized protein LOC131165532 n=1 Tax=Malania oleifera TaxID=397392 RepID=UPI0025AEA365|nr:uncharacterized protein LOC131165532 [Malania oleifera]
MHTNGRTTSLLQIEHDAKFFSRLLSRERSSSAASSRRIYYGGAAASIPFLWESRPGTPKHPKFSDSSPNDDGIPPPITPPPSYTYPQTHSIYKYSKHSAKPNLLHAIFTMLPRSRRRSRTHMFIPPISSSSMSSSLSSSRSSSSYCSPPPTNSTIRDDDRFNAKRKSSGRFSGCCSVGNMKNALLSVVGNRSPQR